LIETVVTVLIIGIVAAVAVPAYSSARERTKSRLAGAVVAQTVSNSLDTAYSTRRLHTLAVVDDSLLQLTPAAGDPETVLDLSDPSLGAIAIPSSLSPFSADLTIDRSGIPKSSVSWGIVVAGYITSVQVDKGRTDPTIDPPARATKAQTDSFILRILK